ncbi:MAG: FixH family protein [Pseudomonadota bacterium]
MMPHRLTGWHVLAIFVTGFSIIIAVNLTLAYNAVATFPGLETRNSFSASQTFQSERAAQDALGWEVSATLEGNTLTLSIDDAIGPIVPEITSATMGRATHVYQDLSPDFRHNGVAFVAEMPDLKPGNWNLRLEARAADGTAFRQRVIVESVR